MGHCDTEMTGQGFFATMMMSLSTEVVCVVRNPSMAESMGCGGGRVPTPPIVRDSFPLTSSVSSGSVLFNEGFHRFEPSYFNTKV